MRPTSIAAWERINREGLVGPFQLEVYNILYSGGPMTAGEAWRVYAARHPKSARGRNEVAKRVSELARFGLIEELGERPCNATGFVAMVVKVNDQLPVKRDKKTTITRKRLKAELFHTLNTIECAIGDIESGRIVEEDTVGMLKRCVDHLEELLK